MNPTENSNQDSGTMDTRKPRIAIMGEFSAGKSTLANLLIGSDPLPVRITATQLPPVWVSYGDKAPYRVDLEGNTTEVDLENLDKVPLDETRVIRVFLKSDILELCDLIDMPGISDPNMSSDVWERVIDHADGVLWCSHATQAWRQSEAAVWKSLPEKLYDKSFLLLTRFDKILTEVDQQRVVKRVCRETEGLFAALFPISLTNAISAQDDRGQWELSGAEEFAQDLVDLVRDMATSIEPDQGEPFLAPAPLQNADNNNVLHLDSVIKKDEANTSSVTPVRVKARPASTGKAKRPARDDASTAWADAVLNVDPQKQRDQMVPAGAPERP